MYGYGALFGVALLAVLQPASGACQQVTSISSLCSAFSSQTCAVWAGKGSKVQLPSACTATRDFDLECAADAAVFACPAGDCFRVATSATTSDVTLTILHCTISGAFVVSGYQRAAITRALVLENVSIEDGSVDVKSVPVAFNNVSITKTTLRSSALRIYNNQATATTLTIRCNPSYSPTQGGGIYMYNAKLEAEVVDIQNCRATSQGGLVFAYYKAILTVTKTLDLRDGYAVYGAGCLYVGQNSVVTASGTLNLQNCNGVNGQGGAVYGYYGTLTAGTVHARDNNARYGGCFYLRYTTFTVTGNTVLERCTSIYAGGGIGLYAGTATVQSLTTAACSSSSSTGGALFASSYARLTVTKWITLCNRAYSTGTDIAWQSTYPMVVKAIQIYVDESTRYPAYPISGYTQYATLQSGKIFTNSLTSTQVASNIFLKKLTHESSIGCPVELGQPASCGYTTCTEEPEDICNQTTVCDWDGTGCTMKDESASVPTYTLGSGVMEKRNEPGVKFWFSDEVVVRDPGLGNTICKLLCYNGTYGRMARMLSAEDAARMTALRTTTANAFIDGSDLDIEGTWKYSDGVVFYSSAHNCLQADCPWVYQTPSYDFLHLTNDMRWRTAYYGNAPFFCEFPCEDADECNEDGETCPYKCEQGRCVVNGECCGSVNDEAGCKNHHPHCEWVKNGTSNHCTNGRHVCPEIDDIDDLCDAFKTKSCAVWIGMGSVPVMKERCVALHDFSLSCADDASAFQCSNAGCFSFGPETDDVGDITVTITSCKLAGKVTLSGDTNSKYFRSVAFENVVVEGAIDISQYKDVLFYNVSVSSSTATRGLSRVRLYNVVKANATELNVRCTDTSSRPNTGGGIFLYNAEMFGVVVDVRGCQANYGGGIYMMNSKMKVSDEISISGCSSTQQGGGMYKYNSDVPSSRVVRMRDCKGS
ncbi:hypothetical protein DIPPA_52893, partial [Diplonema papillatum]